MEVGQKVEVRSQFDQAWSDGFELHKIVETDNGPRFRVKRLSDGMILPRDFTRDEVRRERRRSMWWY